MLHCVITVSHVRYFLLVPPQHLLKYRYHGFNNCQDNAIVKMVSHITP